MDTSVCFKFADLIFSINNCMEGIFAQIARELDLCRQPDVDNMQELVDFKTLTRNFDYLDVITVKTFDDSDEVDVYSDGSWVDVELP